MFRNLKLEAGNTIVGIFKPDDILKNRLGVVYHRFYAVICKQVCKTFGRIPTHINHIFCKMILGLQEIFVHKYSKF